MSIVPFNLQKNLIVNASGNLMCIDARQPFTFKVDTTKGNGFPSFKLPLTNTTHNFNYSVNDGTPVYITTYNQPETLISFPTHGIYEIKIRGLVGNWYDNNTGDVQKYIEVSKFGTTEFASVDRMFYGATNLKITCDEPINAQKSKYARFFCAGSGIEHIPPKIFKLLTNCVDITSSFAGCLQLVTPIPDGLIDNITKLTTYVNGFNGCKNLKGGVPRYYFKYNVKLQELTYFCQNNNNMDGDVYADIFETLVDLTSIANVFYMCQKLKIQVTRETLINNKKIIGIANYMYQCLVATGTFPTLRYLRGINSLQRVGYLCRNLAIPPDLFDPTDMTYLYSVTSWLEFLRCNNTAYSHTGTLQDFWNYANPASVHTGVFMNCTALTNYNDLRLVWPT